MRPNLAAIILFASFVSLTLLTSCDRSTSGFEDGGQPTADLGQSSDRSDPLDVLSAADSEGPWFFEGGVKIPDAGSDSPAQHDSGPTADMGASDSGLPADLSGPPDSAPPADTLAAQCGNTQQEPGEVCDDGNTADGDYCSGDCQSVTGRCGDGTRQSNETCDDGVTVSCATDHDGGDGACVPPGSCSPGYVPGSGGACVANTTGLTVPCKQGPGWTVFRFHYSGSSKSPQIDVWDASCSYSYASGSACNVYAVYPGFGSVSYTSQGYPILTTTQYLRARFSVAGLKFTKAAVYIQARSYATASSTWYRVWSPLYGSKINGPVDNDWVYDWYGLDWTGYLTPTDKPSLTAIQIYADKGSGKLAVAAVELCVN